MGSKMSKSTVALGKDFLEYAKTNPREATILVWAGAVLSKVGVEKLRELRSGSQNQTKTVRVKKGLTVKQFTTADVGKTDLSWTGAVEYWVTVIMRMVECGFMYKYGYRFFLPSKDGSTTVFTRFRNLFFAVFCALPVLDIVVPEDWSNPDDDVPHKKYDMKFRAPLYLWTALELYSTVKVIEAMVNPRSKLSTRDWWGLMGATALFNGGIGINTSHCLIHKDSKFEKVLGHLLLMNVNYMHWASEHLIGHHEHVATPNDPASAKLDESVYAFLPRTFIGSFLSANALEQKRLKDNNLPFYHNRMILNITLPFLWAAAIAKYTNGGFQAIKIFYLNGILSASLLELVNYIEHYGLSREKQEDGSYEPVNPTHSWNAPHRLSNSFLYKLQRHSDHHAWAGRPYHILRNFKESPQLPSGYPGMILLSLFPPIFRWIMNPLVKATKLTPEHYNEDGTFNKDDEWKNAEKVAKTKMLGFSLSCFMIGSYLIRSS